MTSDDRNRRPAQFTFAMPGALDRGADAGPVDDAPRDVNEVLAALRDRLRARGGAG